MSKNCGNCDCWYKLKNYRDGKRLGSCTNVDNIFITPEDYCCEGWENEELCIE